MKINFDLKRSKLNKKNKFNNDTHLIQSIPSITKDINKINISPIPQILQNLNKIRNIIKSNSDFVLDNKLIYNKALINNIQSVIENKVEPNVKPVIENKVEPNVQPVIENNVEMNIQPHIENKVEPIIQPVIENKVEPIIQPVIKNKVEPIIQPVIENKVEPIIRPVIENKVEPIIQPAILKPVIENTKNNKIIKNITSDNSNKVPLKIFQTWHNKDLPPIMKLTVETLKHQNKEFKHFLYDDNDCRDFIKNNFSQIVLTTFDTLIPGAYKADLWRYCILYIYGGIYLDIKFKCTNGFKLIELIHDNHWVIDRDDYGIYNAFIVSKKGNPILLKAINSIVYNVKNRFYGKNSLCPTGPHLLAVIISNDDKKRMKLKHNNNNDYKFIEQNNKIIIDSYTEYYNEQNNYKKTTHYSTLWEKKKIYA
jgi:mannosyltransferase OCH1-like enzyme